MNDHGKRLSGLLSPGSPKSRKAAAGTSSEVVCLHVQVYVRYSRLCQRVHVYMLILCTTWHTGRDIRRLKCNWVFIALLCTMFSIGYVSPLSTVHQFIINPPKEVLNKTEEVNIFHLRLCVNEDD